MAVDFMSWARVVDGVPVLKVVTASLTLFVQR
jgi:hypothetical protein